MTLAVLVPFRDRMEHLKAFLPAVSAMLRTEKIPHSIIVVEQVPGKPFNRGKLLNIGFQMVGDAVTHVVLHDVDMLPGTPGCYAEAGLPTHLAGQAGQFGYKMPYPQYFGGVTLFPRADFERANGFNNDYWGWGCEDDDLLDRCRHHGLQVEWRPGRFESLPHTSALAGGAEAQRLYTLNVGRLQANHAAHAEYATNGLNSLRYEQQSVQHLVYNGTAEENTGVPFTLCTVEV